MQELPGPLMKSGVRACWNSRARQVFPHTLVNVHIVDIFQGDSDAQEDILITRF